MQEIPTEARGLNRRQLVQRVLGTAGAGLALGPAALEAAESKTAEPGWKPVFFDPHQNETVIALAERIIPNSTQAQVSRFIDTLIAVDTRENQVKFLTSLGAFDHEAITRYQKPFKDLAEGQQNTILVAASTAQAAEPGHHGRRRHRAAATPSGEEPVLTMRDHFENIKGWVSGAFYSSEVGMKELGWTGQVAWGSLPGCPHPDGHA